MAYAFGVKESPLPLCQRVALPEKEEEKVVPREKYATPQPTAVGNVRLKFALTVVNVRTAGPAWEALVHPTVAATTLTAPTAGPAQETFAFLKAAPTTTDALATWCATRPASALFATQTPTTVAQLQTRYACPQAMARANACLKAAVTATRNAPAYA